MAYKTNGSGRGRNTEQLKSTDQMAWVGKMNNILNRKIKTINAEIIYSKQK